MSLTTLTTRLLLLHYFNMALGSVNFWIYIIDLYFIYYLLFIIIIFIFYLFFSHFILAIMKCLVGYAYMYFTPI